MPFPAVPDEVCLYAIGDIHGEYKLLQELMGFIASDAATIKCETRQLVFLGDLIDRGRGSKDVIAYLLNGLPKDFDAVFLRGNHEDAMLKFLQGDETAGGHWLQFGGAATLASYGVEVSGSPNLPSLRERLQRALPPAHQALLENTRLSYICGDYYFVHAGLRPQVPLEQQDDEDKLWIRDEFLNSSYDFGKIIVHGHTINAMPDLRTNRIGIDTGAYATGRLTALRLQGSSRKFLVT